MNIAKPNCYYIKIKKYKKLYINCKNCNECD